MGIHPSAIVEDGAVLGADVDVGPFAIIESGAEVGAGCKVRAHAVIKRYTRLGPGCTVHEHAILGGEPQDLGFKGGASYVEVGARTTIREGVTIHRGTIPESVTRVGPDCFLMAYAHVAHNCTLGERVIVANNVKLAGHVEVAERAFLSGGVGVHQFCRIGRLAMLGGNAKAAQDCLPFVIVDGLPARSAGINVIGLRRAGVGATQVRALRTAYRLLLLSGLSQVEALAQMAALGEPLVDELIGFVRGSKRGFCHARRAQATGRPGDGAES